MVNSAILRRDYAPNPAAPWAVDTTRDCDVTATGSDVKTLPPAFGETFGNLDGVCAAIFQSSRCPTATGGSHFQIKKRVWLPDGHFDVFLMCCERPDPNLYQTYASWNTLAYMTKVQGRHKDGIRDLSWSIRWGIWQP